MTSATVIQFRRGRKHFKPRHFLIEIEGIESREKAKEFVGSKVIWKSEGKEAKVINGVIAAAHGNKGVLRTIFERGLPGQAIGTNVEIDKKILKSSDGEKNVSKKTTSKKKEVKE